MSKIFSLIGLETNTGIRDITIMGGISEVEDWGCTDYISVVVQSFCYGNGPPEPAAMEDLQWIGAHHEIIM